jgi:hypothetical protein
MQLYEAVHKAWVLYQRRERLHNWLKLYSRPCPKYVQRVGDSGFKFQTLALKFSGVKALHFDWQPNGDCIVQGTIYLTLLSD